MKSGDRGNRSLLRFASVWKLVGWMLVGIVVWLSLTPAPISVPSVLGWDKAQHCLAYASLMFWFRMAFGPGWAWPAFLIGLGVGLEFLQQLGGVRVLDGFDMLANTLGVLIGALLARSALGGLLLYIERWLVVIA